MKKLSLPFFILYVLCISSCDEKLHESKLNLTVSDSGTKTSVGQMANSEEYFVSESDVECYIAFKNMLCKGENQVVSAEPMLSIDGAVSAYTIQYKDGWEIISADKRAPLVLANGGDGECNFSEWPNAARMWLDELVYEESQFFSCQDRYCGSESKDVRENIDQSLFFWQAISQPEQLLQTIEPETKVPINSGWQLVSTQEEAEEYTIPHLIDQQWYQGFPYNRFCPLMQGDTLRALAGCVAVSGSMTLDYLHNTLGEPNELPNGVVSFLQNQYPYLTSFSWSDLDFLPYGPAALIAYVGNAVNMSYGVDASSAHTRDLVSSVFVPNNINCTYHDYYDADLIVSSLMDSIPVIVRAEGTRKTILGIPYYQDGHSFIIDGSKYYRTRYTSTYRWVHAPNLTPPQDETRITISYSSPYSIRFQMRWGWNPLLYSCDNVYFSSSGNWNSRDSYNFIYNRGMIAGFSVLNNN